MALIGVKPLPAGSIFDRKPLHSIYDEIRRVYAADERPWVVGYSGGKDSTCTLQLIWYALRDLPQEKRKKPVYVITSDTLVETPVIVSYIDRTLQRINEAGAAQGLSITAQKVVPQLKDTFWVNLIGKGYPAPYNRFRWCTDRLKIDPANRFILDRVAEHGEVVMALGVRRTESATRAQTMSLLRMENSILTRHTTLPNAFVYAPIEEFSTDDVWSYLLQTPNPWGNDNQDLLALYKTAQAGECPLVIDKTTPSCGNSRFGCWVCTVVESDHSMEALIEHGEDWMEPMLEFRNFLASTKSPEAKIELRDHKRRNGQATVMDDGNFARGPYRFAVRQDILRRLLRTEREIQKNGPSAEGKLISREELIEIRRLWRTEQNDWADSLPRIYEEEAGEPLGVPPDDAAAFTVRDRERVERLSVEFNVPGGLVTKMLDLERELGGMSRRAGIFDRLKSLLNEEWRGEEEILASRAASGANTAPVNEGEEGA